MVQSLLPAELVPDHAALRTLMGAAGDRAAQLWPQWPTGHGAARITAEYLVGRSRGWLDVSGRPTTAEAPVAWDDRPILVIDDDEGGLCLAACAVSEAVGRYHDDLRWQRCVGEVCAPLGAAEPRLVEAGQHCGAPGAEPLVEPGSRVVISAPKATAALREYLQVIAGAAAEVIVVGREKHMSAAINAALAEHFGRVDVSPGLAKCRLIIGSQPLMGSQPLIGSQPRARHTCSGHERPASEFPHRQLRAARNPDLPRIEVVSYGACYGGTQIDHGTSLLLDALVEHRAQLPTGGRIVDLGCGNGWLLAQLGLLLGPRELIGVDVSKAATASAAATTTAAGLTDTAASAATRSGASVRLLSADASRLDDPALRELRGAVDLVVLNPPFHTGHTVETDTAHGMIRTASQLLAGGGRFVCVFNSHLGYRSAIDRYFGSSSQWARDRRFTVIAAGHRGQASEHHGQAADH